MRIVLGVTGCIAAYKSAVILRLLQEAGCEIFPVMTSSARQFITPLTLEKLSGNRVITDLFNDATREIEHIALARRSDLLLVAPATANILAKFSAGIADDFLTTLYVSTVTPVVVAPAMNFEMWRHPTTRENLEKLRRRGVEVVDPESGYLACGEYGEGRLAEPVEIVQRVLGLLRRKNSLRGLQVIVTAGPTIEDIDPVRYLSNRSSGKMGYALASEAWKRGAKVTLISGPTFLTPPAGVENVPVRSADEMAEAVLSRYPEVDVVVMAAAVSDFRPETVSPQKIKKNQAELKLRLLPTRDVLAELGRIKERQYLVGFAAESENLKANASEKLARKNLDLVVGNDISRGDRGFQVDSNQIVILDRQGREFESGLLSKAAAAAFVWDRIESEFRARSAIETTVSESGGTD